MEKEKTVTGEKMATPTLTLTPVVEVFELEYQVDLPALFRDELSRVSLRAYSPLTIERCGIRTDEFWRGEYFFAAVTRFPEIIDGTSINEIIRIWNGVEGDGFAQLIIPVEFKELFSAEWGTPNSEQVMFLPIERIVFELWDKSSSIAIVPFDQVEPRMKVLSVNEQNPMLKSFMGESYPLVFSYCLFSDSSEVEGNIGEIPKTNRDENKLTTLLMTGVTALTRETAYKMEQNGIIYPAEQIKMWFDEADIVHISNEVSFTEECPDPTISMSPSRFCSRTVYLDLLKHINTGVIELTGNHLLDYGEDAFLESLSLFEQNNLAYFGGGENLDRANAPLLIVDGGNQFAFLGCNAAGPESVFATHEYGGANPCDIEALGQKIQELSLIGYQVIVGIQYYEACQVEPMSGQREDMRKLAEAGAVIVSGSQAHCPQGITFIEDSFVHYGLGNLFFDQMWDVYRNGFLDYHVFYDGRYLGTQLFTTRLEDASQPRPMTEEERHQFLENIFSQSVWGVK